MFKKLIVILSKFGIKILSLFTARNLLAALLIVVNLIIYAFLWGWQYSLLLVYAISIHEQGHIWAMRKCNIPTKGFYLIPFVGGVSFGSFTEKTPASDNAFISIMGPLWGALSALITYVLYMLTHSSFWALATFWQAAFNLGNLLPIYPLDGGRICKDILSSISPKINDIYIFILPIILGGLLAIYPLTILLLLLVLAVYNAFKVVFKPSLSVPHPLNLSQAITAISNHLLTASLCLLLCKATFSVFLDISPFK